MKRKICILTMICLVMVGICFAAPQVAQAAGFSINSINDVGDGSARISWSASSSGGPYSVLARWLPDGYQRTIENNITNTSCYTGRMVAGETYEVVIRDRNGNTTNAYTYTVPFRSFSEFGVKITLNLKTKSNGRFKEVQSFSASDIEQNLLYTTYCAYIRLTYSRLNRQRDYNITNVFTMPNGDPYVHNFGSFQLNAGKSERKWDPYDFNSVFRNIYNALGEIPVGEWHWSIYFDGQFVSSASFQIRW